MTGQSGLTGQWSTPRSGDQTVDQSPCAHDATSETARDYLAERRDFLHVFVVRSPAGEGWDVALRVDGTYGSKADAEAAVAAIRERLDGLTDVSAAGRDWWDGPPWRRKADR